MARDHAQIRLDIWSDDDFRALPGRAQHLYWILLTHPELSYCGVLDWRPAKLSGLVGDWTAEDVQAAAGILIDRLYILVDTATEEVLVRSFVRHDGLMKMPKMATAMATAHAAVGSIHLRQVVVGELQRLHAEEPDLKGWGSEKASALLSKPSVDPSTYPCGNPCPNPSVYPSGNPKPEGSGSPTGNPPVSPAPAPAPAPTTSKELVEHDERIAADAASKETAEPSPEPEARGDVEELCAHLERRIAQNGVKGRKINTSWRTAARRLLDRDGRQPDEAHALIDWCQNDEFWRSNILSMPTFREQYDKLRLQAQAGRGGQRLHIATSNGQRTWTREDLDNLLGPSSWQLPQPPNDLPEEQHQTWARAQWQANRDKRIAQAEAKLATRGLA